MLFSGIFTGIKNAVSNILISVKNKTMNDFRAAYDYLSIKVFSAALIQNNNNSSLSNNEIQNHALRLAVDANDIDLLKLLLLIPEIREHANFDNNLIVQFAANRGELQMVRDLLSIPAIRNTVNAYTLLFQAHQNFHYHEATRLAQTTTNNHTNEADIQQPNLSNEIRQELIARPLSTINIHDMRELTQAIIDGNFERAQIFLSMNHVSRNINTHNATQLLRWAVQHGHAALTGLLLKITQVHDNAATYNMALELAITSKHLVVVQELLAIPSIRDGFILWPHNALEKALITPGILQVLLATPGLQLNSEYSRRLLVGSIIYKQPTSALMLLSIPAIREVAHLCGALYAAAEEGYTDVVQELMRIPAVRELDATRNNYTSFIALDNGHTKLVLELLSMPDVGGNSIITKHAALAFAARSGNINLIRELLKLPSIRAAAATCDCAALAIASRHGQVHIVQELLSIPEVLANAHARENRALVNAIEREHVEVALALLTLPSVREGVVDAGRNTMMMEPNDLLIWACKHGHTELVRELLTIPMVRDLADVRHNQALQYAAEYNNFDILQQLLAIPAVRDNAHSSDWLGEIDNRALIYAAINGNVAMVIELLNIPTVANLAATNDNLPIRAAHRNGHHLVVEILRNTPAVQQYENLINRPRATTGRREPQRADDFPENHEESSMRALNTNEEKLLQGFIQRYTPELNKRGGVDRVINSIKSYLRDEYLNEPAQLADGTILPLTWNEFSELRLEPNKHDEALVKYYTHKKHAAWRYFLPNNKWMSLDARHVVRNEASESVYANFAEHKSILAILFLAMIDPNPETLSDGFSFEMRIKTFGLVFEQLNRAHNYDRPDYQIQGDMPSCRLGVKSRLFQAAKIGHACGKFLDEGTINEELNALICQHYRNMFQQLNDVQKLHLINLLEQYSNVEVSEEIAEQLIAELKKSDSDSNAVADIQHYFVESCRRINPKARKLAEVLISKDDKLKELFPNLNAQPDPDSNSITSVSAGLNDYDISREQRDGFLTYFKNKFHERFTEEESGMVEKQFADNDSRHQPHITRFCYAANLDGIFFSRPAPFTKPQQQEHSSNTSNRSSAPSNVFF